MTALELPQLYLITPPELDVQTFPDLLGKVLDSTDIACIRLDLSTTDEGILTRAADACREVAHARDIPLVITDHFLLAERLGLDGVHLSDGARLVRKARAELGKDAIVGAHCGTARHEGLNAGEAGADYVSFGPVGVTELGDGSFAEPDLFTWWSDVVEVPIVAEGALDVDAIRDLTPITDFFAIGDEIWQAEDPVAALAALLSAMQP